MSHRRATDKFICIYIHFWYAGDKTAPVMVLAMPVKVLHHVFLVQAIVENAVYPREAMFYRYWTNLDPQFHLS